jgi:hypothetical protein
LVTTKPTLVDGDDLVLKGSVSPPPSVLDLLRRHKPELMALLQSQGHAEGSRLSTSRPPGLAAENAGADRSNTGTSADAFEERAAIVEFDAGIPSAWAEGYAAMQCATPPAWAARHPGLWAALINAVGKFLDRWARQAAELGWDPEDLFGAAPAAPLARSDQQGLVFFLQGGREVVAMTVDTASIRLPSGTVQTFRRPHKNARAPRTAPLWELVAGEWMHQGAGGPLKK